MSNITLCMRKASDTPYFLEDACLRIYSIEELCYYLCENTDMLEKSIMKEELCRYIGDELKMPGLAGALLHMLKSGCSLADFAAEILRGAFYCGEERIQGVRRILSETEDMDLLMRRKRRGDYFYENNRFFLAIGEYGDILACADEKEDPGFCGVVLHNMGAANAKLFCFKRAAECFRRAYGLNREEESLKQYLAAVRLGKTREQYIRYLKEHKLNGQTAVSLEQEMEEYLRQRKDGGNARALDEIKRCREEGRVPEYYERIDETLKGWKDGYRKYRIQ